MDDIRAYDSKWGAEKITLRSEGYKPSVDTD